MPTRKTKTIQSSLCSKGFQVKEGDHTYLQLFVENGKTPVFTKLSHGKSEYDDSLLGAMARQLKVSKKELLDLIDCPMTQEMYLAHLRAKGLIP